MRGLIFLTKTIFIIFIYIFIIFNNKTVQVITRNNTGKQHPNSIKPYHIRIIGLLLLQSPRTRISVYQLKTLLPHSSNYILFPQKDRRWWRKERGRSREKKNKREREREKEKRERERAIIWVCVCVPLRVSAASALRNTLV